MKFLIFSAQYLPHMGGIENYTYNVSKQLVENGHSVTIVTNNTEQSMSFEESDNLKVMRFNCMNFIDGRFPIYLRDSVFKKVVSLLNEDKFDLVVVNSRFYFHSLFAVKYAHKRKLPVIVIDHGTSHLTVHNKILDFFGACFEHFLTYLVKRSCKDFYAVSKASSNWLSHFGISSKGQIYNAIDIDAINQCKLSHSCNFRDTYQIPENAKVIVFTGRLLKEKGIVQLVNAVKKWNSLHLDSIYLFLAGEGILSEYLKKEADEFIIPLGRLPFNQIIHLLVEGNIFFLPSDSEGFSTSLLEAAACKDYIVTTNRGGAREVILDERYGMVIENNSNEEVYQALEYALSLSEKDVQDAVMNTYSVLVNNFTWKITANTLIEIAKKLS